MAWWGPVIWETYGGMEGAATIAKPYRWLEKPGTVGRSVRGVRLSILDDDGIELPRRSGPHLYGERRRLQLPQRPRSDGERVRGRRFSLGDIGYLDEDGYLFISDRAKDMIITGGTNVYPAEIEATLLTHPEVDDVAVIGIPDDDWGEQVLAIVEPREGFDRRTNWPWHCSPTAPADLAAYKCPRRIEFRDGPAPHRRREALQAPDPRRLLGRTRSPRVNPRPITTYPF